jgi:hypothetical protein
MIKMELCVPIRSFVFVAASLMVHMLREYNLNEFCTTKELGTCAIRGVVVVLAPSEEWSVQIGIDFNVESGLIKPGKASK